MPGSHYAADPNTGAERVLDLGGLIVRARCSSTDDGRAYLSVGARTRVDDAARAVAFHRDDSGSGTYAFSAQDFDRDSGWYDFAGAVFDRTSGTLAYTRPDSGGVSFSVRGRSAG